MTKIANDNEVAYRRSQGNVIGKNVLWQDETASSNNNPKQDKAQQRPFGQVNAVSVTEAKYGGGIALSLFLWLASLFALIASVVMDASGVVQFLTSIIVIWMGLWVGYLGHDRQKSRLSDLGVFTAITGIFSAILIIGSQFDIALLSMTNCLGIMSIIALICAVTVSSGIALIISASFLLMAAFLYFGGQAISPATLMSFPALWISQLFLASKFKSKLAIGLVMGVGAYSIYSGLSGAVNTGYVSAHLAIVLMTLLGVLLYQFGKAVQAAKGFGSYFHILGGWLFAIGGLIALQFYWFEPRLVFWKSATVSSYNDVFMPLTIGLLTIGTVVACLMRWKHDNLKLSGGIIISGLCLAFAGVHLFSEEIFGYFKTQSPVVFSTQISVMIIPMAIACAVLVAAGMMILNSFLWGRLAMLCAGFGALALQIFLISKSDLFTPDNIMIFVLLAFVAMSVCVFLSSRTLSDVGNINAKRRAA